ncbi:MAG: ECF-type sigma factor [Phycisphaerae bacterium]
MTEDRPAQPAAAPTADPAGTPDLAPDLHLPDLFRELRHVATRFLSRERPGSLQPTALVNEAFLRMLGAGVDDALPRSEFFTRACRCMSHVLIDHARRKRSLKRTPPGNVAAEEAAATGAGIDALEIEELVVKLEGIAPRAAEVVRLRFYLGLTIAEAAVAMDTSPSTVEHDWRFARACLACWLADDPGKAAKIGPA